MGLRANLARSQLIGQKAFQRVVEIGQLFYNPTGHRGKAKGRNQESDHHAAYARCRTAACYQRDKAQDAEDRGDDRKRPACQRHKEAQHRCKQRQHQDDRENKDFQDQSHIVQPLSKASMFILHLYCTMPLTGQQCCRDFADPVPHFGPTWPEVSCQFAVFCYNNTKRVYEHAATLFAGETNYGQADK